MAKLNEQAKWENEIYRIEENDPVHGGEDGITNKPTKQLANRTQYLKQQTDSHAKKFKPLKITATSQNTAVDNAPKAEDNGHTHAIDKASTTVAGIVQLEDTYTSDSSTKALTARMGKALKALIDGLTRNLNNYIPNSKKSSSIDSPSADTVATSSAVKTLNDRLNVSKIPVKGSSTMVTFDLANREHWKEQIGSVYKTTGHFQLCFHNLSTHNLTNLPLSAKSPVQLDVSIVGAFSVIRCHYLNLNRTFISNANFNSSTFTLRWHEMMMLDQTGKVPRSTVFAGGVETGYRVVIRRADTRSGNSPYFWMVDNGVNLDEDIAVRRVIGNIEVRAGKTGTDDGEIRSTLRTHLLTDKNTEIELSTRGAENSWRRIFTAFSKTGNLTIGATTDNGKDRLQVNGTVSATAPADSSNDNQLPNTFWVRRFVNNMVETAKRWVQEYWVKKNLTDEDLNNITAAGVYGQTANVKATAARHYPEALAGTLLVTPSAYGVQQEYTTYTSKKYVRGKEGSNWKPWQRVDALDAVNKTGDNVLNGSVTLTRNQQGIANVVTLRNQNGGAGQGSAVYFQAVDNTHAGAVAIVDDGHKTRFEVWTIPVAGNNAFGAVERTMLHQNGNLWVKNYGWLHDKFVSQSNGILDNVLKASHRGHGGYANQYTSDAPFLVVQDGSRVRDTYHPFIKGRVREAGQYGTALSFGYTTKQGSGDGFGRGVIQLIEDNGTYKHWFFEHNGDFYSPGDVVIGGGKKLSEAAMLRDFTYQKVGNFEIRRYPDGTMIQTYTINQNDLRDWREKSFNWAQAFVGVPMIFTHVYSSVNYSHDCGVNVRLKSTNTTCYYWEYEHGGDNQGNVRIHFLAIGRWK